MAPWTWTFRKTARASPRVVLENYLDEEHVAAFHRDGVASYRVLERGRDAALVEIGTKILGVTITHTEWVQVLPPFRMIVRSRLFLESIEARAQTRIEPDGDGSIIETAYDITPAWFLRPFKWLILGRMQGWKEEVWKEDLALLERRQKVIDLGFKDGLPPKLLVPLPKPAPADLRTPAPL